MSCEFNLLLGDSGGCVYQMSAFYADIWHRISANQWFYVINSKDTLTVQYSHEQLTVHTLPRSGIITLPSGTTGYTSQRLLHAGISNSTMVQGDIKIVEAPTPEFKFPVIHQDYVLPTITRLDLADLKKTREMLAEAQADAHFSHNVTRSLVETRQESSYTFSLLSWLFGSLSFSTWCIIFIILYLIYKYYGRMAQVTTSPVNFITQHLPSVLPEFIHSPALRRKPTDNTIPLQSIHTS